MRCKDLFSMKVIKVMGIDVSFCCMQMYIMSIKFFDNLWIPYDTDEILAPINRQNHLPFYELCVNYRAQLVFETVCVIVMIMRCI